MTVIRNRRVIDIVKEGKPFFQDVGIVGLVPDNWGGPWMSRQQVLTRLGSYFEVIWVNPAPGWRQAWSGYRGKYPDRPIPGFEVYHASRWLSQVYRPRALASFLAGRRLREAQHLLRTKGCTRFVLYLWRPEFAYALDHLPFDVSCYHIVDEYSFSDVEEAISQNEAALLRRVDQVYIHSPASMDKKGHFNSNTLHAPNGVDYEAYMAPCNEPRDLALIPHPRIGYVGIVKKQLNLSLLHTLAQRHQNWSFVFVGPMGILGDKRGVFDDLIRAPNVYYLGSKEVNELPAYTQHLDVCTMCYEMNDYTKFIFPLKLHEYLASGRPIVASPIRTLKDFDNIIHLASTVDEWSSAIVDAMHPIETTVSAIAARRAIAHEYDWDRLVARIAEALCDRLGHEYGARFRSIFTSSPPTT